MLTIVFDLDGTLIDTAPDLISTLNLILSGEGLPPVAYNDGRRMTGGGILGMIERALNAEGHYPPKPEIDRMFRAFVDHYGAHIANSFASGNCPVVGHLLQQSAFRAPKHRRTKLHQMAVNARGAEFGKAI
jgi:phosphoglycolate phosphatase-like HAD superfamily hydrolase